MDYGFTIPENETIAFKVGGNPSTGYSWHYMVENVNNFSDSDNAAHAFDVKQEYIATKYPPGHLGGGGTYYFTLTANEGAEKGDKGILTIAYFRTWEDGVKNSYTFPIFIG